MMSALKQKKNFAYERLKTVLDYWKRDKLHNSYYYLIICARKKGKKIESIWINSQADVHSVIEKAFAGVICEATSFEIEFLYSPESRKINLSEKNQWNSLRGKRAVLIDYQGHTTRWSSLEILSKNLSFQNIGKKHLTRITGQINSYEQQEDGYSKKHLQKIPVTLYRTKQYYCGNNYHKDLKTTLPPLPEQMFRGNQIVKPTEINRQKALVTLKAMTYWLANQVDEQGQAEYKYWPSRGIFSSSNNAIRQWMATVCLNRAAAALNDQALQKVASSNLSYNIKTTFRSEKELGYILMDGNAKLGAASLAALAILESPRRKEYVQQEYALNRLIGHLSKPDGSFDTFYIPRERKDNQNFYSGEALLFLANRYVISRNPEELKRFMSGFNYYRDWHLKNRNPAFVPWHTQAYFLVWKVTKEDSLKDFIFEMNDWLLSMQQWESAEFPDMQGRFYDSKRPHFGPPHASSTGVYLEGLIDAYALAKECDDSYRAENYRIAIARGIRSIIQLQYKNEIDCYYIKNTDKVLGGIRTTVYDNSIRIDNVQHALMAFLKINTYFSDSDYQIVSPEKLKNISNNNESIKIYKHFKKINFPIPTEKMRNEIAKNATLWLANTSRQDKIKVQRETQTIFLRSALKPYPRGVSGNDIHESHETKYATFFPVIMQTLRNFSDAINGKLSRVTIVRLQPESRVYPHIDEGEYYKYRDRYHIVLESPTGSEMTAGKETVLWQEGELWWFDNKAIHEAFNRGKDFRVHIIFDVLPNNKKESSHQKICTTNR